MPRSLSFDACVVDVRALHESGDHAQHLQLGHRFRDDEIQQPVVAPGARRDQ